MQIYLVGGAVRDALLGLPVHDRDWVVTGATPAQMLALGYQQVGRDFPVFLHPQTGEEYALARTERKSGQGYHGFVCDFSPQTTLEDDLLRRDLTINAIAEDANGRRFDPFGGAADIEKRLLRHVSPAFREDPLRVLRLLRFYARFAGLGFTIAPETEALCRAMIAADELHHLTRERIWLECEKALQSPHAPLFFKMLADWDGLAVLGFAPPESAWTAMLTDLEQALSRTEDTAQRLAMFLWKSEQSQKLIENLPLPKRFVTWIQLLQQQGEALALWDDLNPERRWEIFRACGALKVAGDLDAFLNLLNLQRLAPQLHAVQNAIHALQPATFIAQGYTGSALGDKIRQEQLRLLA